MTIYATPVHHHTNDTDLTDFAFGTGSPSIDAHWSHDDRLCEEDFFIDGLRGYISALASRCHRATPSEYTAIVADLTGGDNEEPLARRSARLTHLLHGYATYIPAPGCGFLDLGPVGYHGWVSPDRRVVFDIVTTLTWTELTPADDQGLVRSALRDGTEFGHHFAGVRLVVLDAQFESSFYYPTVTGEPFRSIPLHMMDGAQ